MKNLLIFSIIAILISCNQKGNQNLPSDANPGMSPIESDFCKSFNLALNGVFANKYTEGTMTWKGGIEGTVEISGVDYNEMTCSYKVVSCSDGTISMNCNGSIYNTEVSLYSPDSLLLGQTTYTRVK